MVDTLVLLDLDMMVAVVQPMDPNAMTVNVENLSRNQPKDIVVNTLVFLINTMMVAAVPQTDLNAVNVKIKSKIILVNE